MVTRAQGRVDAISAHALALTLASDLASTLNRVI